MIIPLELKFEIETAYREAKAGRVDPMAAMARLLLKHPELAEGTEKGADHCLARLVFLTPKGRDVAEDAGLL